MLKYLISDRKKYIIIKMLSESIDQDSFEFKSSTASDYKTLATIAKVQYDVYYSKSIQFLRGLKSKRMEFQ